MARQRARASTQRRPLRPRRTRCGALSVSGWREQASARERVDGAVTMFVRMSGHGASDGRQNGARSQPAKNGHWSVSKPWARRPTATGSRQGLVSLHGFVRRRAGQPRARPRWLGRDSCPTHHGTVRRQDSQDSQDGHEGPTWPSVRVVDHTAVRPSVRRRASQGRGAAREPHGSTGSVRVPEPKQPNMTPCLHRLALCPPLTLSPPYILRMRMYLHSPHF